MQYREFTKSLIFCDFDDILKEPIRYVHLLLLLAVLSKNFKNFHAWHVTEDPKLGCYNPPPPPLKEGLALMKCCF